MKFSNRVSHLEAEGAYAVLAQYKLEPINP